MGIMVPVPYLLDGKVRDRMTDYPNFLKFASHPSRLLCRALLGSFLSSQPEHGTVYLDFEYITIGKKPEKKCSQNDADAAVKIHVFEAALFSRSLGYEMIERIACNISSEAFNTSSLAVKNYILNECQQSADGFSSNGMPILEFVDILASIPREFSIFCKNVGAEERVLRDYSIDRELVDATYEPNSIIPRCGTDKIGNSILYTVYHQFVERWLIPSYLGCGMKPNWTLQRALLEFFIQNYDQVRVPITKMIDLTTFLLRSPHINKIPSHDERFNVAYFMNRLVITGCINESLGHIMSVEVSRLHTHPRYD